MLHCRPCLSTCQQLNDDCTAPGVRVQCGRARVSSYAQSETTLHGRSAGGMMWDAWPGRGPLQSSWMSRGAVLMLWRWRVCAWTS